VFAQQDTVASEPVKISPDFIPPQPREPTFLGQDHGYTVVFRGNGEAIVTAKIVFTNKGEGDLNQLSFRVPKVEPGNITTYQVIRNRTCIQYGPRKYNLETKQYENAECLKYQEPDYYQTYYPNVKYQKAKFELDIDTLTITLPQPVAPNSSGSFFVYFRAFGYAKKNVFGVYNYTFETLKAEDEVKSLRVGISTDSDLVLKNAKGEVQYRFEEPSFAGLAAQESAPAKSVTLDRYVSQIGKGRISKSASNLAPLESYTVKGSYASSNFKLYAKEILIITAVILVFLVLLVLAIRFFVKKLGGIKSETTVVEQKMKSHQAEKIRMLLISIGVSFLSSLLIVGYTIILALVSKYGFGNVYGPQALLVIFLVIFLIIISIFIYAILFFGPGIYIGIKKGFAWGIATLVFTILWLGFYLLVAVLVLNLFFNKRTPIPFGEPFGL
jgi:hypothetical protein